MTGPANPGPDSVDRRRIVAVAGHRGDAATARHHLDDPDPKVREAALRALARAGVLSPAELESALADDDPAVRAAALELAAARPEVPAASIMALLDDPDPRVVETAAWTCGERDAGAGGGTDPDEIVSALARVSVGHDDALCRESAVAALGALGHPAGLPAVLAALDDKPAVRRRAVIALSPFSGASVEAAIDRARVDRDRQVREAVEELRGPAPIVRAELP